MGGWLSLLTLHAIWPFLWIWASLYKPETGYGFSGNDSTDIEKLQSTITDLQQRISKLESQLKDGSQS